MFYRVDFVLGCICLGLACGLGFGQRLRQLGAERTARSFYEAVSVLLVSSLIASSAINLGYSAWYLPWTVGIIGGVTNVCFGALWGIAMRQRSAVVLQQPAVMAALRILIAFTFATAAVGKALSMSAMTDFFSQSGYPIVLLKFITLAEGLGAVAILVPWAFLPALIGLCIDMCGAVVTHIRNGDPLNDSTGAISMLIRLAAIGLLIAISPRPAASNSVLHRRRVRFGVLGAISLLCVGTAVAGAAYLHH